MLASYYFLLNMITISVLVDLLEALANPCYEVQRLLAMADHWRSD